MKTIVKGRIDKYAAVALALALGLLLCHPGVYAQGSGNGGGGGGGSGGGGGGGGSGGNGGGNGSSSTSSGGGTQSTTTTTSESTQTVAFDSSHAVELQINGSPNTVDGTNHAVDGTIDTSNPDKAAVGLSQVTGEWVDGTEGDTGGSGVNIDGEHNDSNITGDVQNNLVVKEDMLEAFIESARNSADATINLATGEYYDAETGQIHNSPPGQIGAEGDVKVVYAKGAVVSGVFTEHTLHLTGNNEGWGVLVVEIDNPDNAQFIMSGQYRWIGLVLVVVNKRPTTAVSILDVRGGGNENHITGGALVYMRNNANSSADDGSIYGQELYRTRGTSDLKYSYDALMNAIAEVKTSVQIRSWRKLEE